MLGLGYDGDLFILAFDHRGSFRKKFFGVAGAPNAEERRRIADAKAVIFEGFQRALDGGRRPPIGAGILVDEQFGADIARTGEGGGLTLAMPVEKSGQDEFDFEYGDAFGEHIETSSRRSPRCSSGTTRRATATLNARQAARLKRLVRLAARTTTGSSCSSCWSRPSRSSSRAWAATPEATTPSCGPRLMRRAIAQLQEAGIEPDIWKIEGIDRREDCEAIVEQCRVGGRDHVACVVLGRGADAAAVDDWLRAGERRSRLSGLRDRSDDLVEPAEGVRRRDAGTRCGGPRDRRELRAIHRGIQGAGELRGGTDVCHQDDRPGGRVASRHGATPRNRRWPRPRRRSAGSRAWTSSRRARRSTDGQITEYHTHVSIRFRIER